MYILIAALLMGKNTMMRKAIRGHLENNPNLEKLLPHIKGNVGFVFTKDDLSEVREKILANRVGLLKSQPCGRLYLIESR